jgi:hypothetical protein
MWFRIFSAKPAGKSQICRQKRARTKCWCPGNPRDGELINAGVHELTAAGAEHAAADQGVTSGYV